MERIRPWRVKLVVPLAAIAATATAAVPAAAADGCAALFADVDFDSERTADPVVLRTIGLNEATTDRFAADVQAAVGLVAPELGGLDGAEICLFADDIPLDPGDYVRPGQRLHAVALVEDGVLALSARTLQLVRPAVGLGLAHLALWQVSGSGYPEPLASAIAQWYVARLEGNLARHHAVMMQANFFQAFGDTQWTAGRQQPVLAWNPEFQESPIGDFVDFAVERRGQAVLLEPEAQLWSDLEHEWSDALRAELLGSSTRSRGWIIGLSVMVVVLAAAAALALLARKQKRTRKGPPQPPPPVVIGGDGPGVSIGGDGGG